LCLNCIDALGNKQVVKVGGVLAIGLLKDWQHKPCPGGRSCFFSQLGACVRFTFGDFPTISVTGNDSFVRTDFFANLFGDGFKISGIKGHGNTEPGGMVDGYPSAKAFTDNNRFTAYNIEERSLFSGPG